MVDLLPRPDTPALLLTSSRPTAGCPPWSQESQSHAALMCGWPLQSAAATPGEAGSAGSHLARPAAERRMFAISMFVNHRISLHDPNTQYARPYDRCKRGDLVFDRLEERKKLIIPRTESTRFRQADISTRWGALSFCSSLASESGFWILPFEE